MYRCGEGELMPRSYEEIVRQSEAMADSLEADDAAPDTSPEEGAVRAADLRRAVAGVGRG